jgi:hypothetical protein
LSSEISADAQALLETIRGDWFRPRFAALTGTDETGQDRPEVRVVKNIRIFFLTLAGEKKRKQWNESIFNPTSRKP